MHTPPSPRRRLLAVAAAAAAAAALTLTGGTAASANGSTDYPGARPGWAKAANAKADAPADTTVEGELAFALRDPAGAEQLAQYVSTPGSPLYGKYVTPAQWIKRFSVSKSTYDSTVRYLKQNGLTITGTPKSRLFVTFRGKVDQFEDLFSTTMKSYRHAGKVVIAPASTPSLPDSVGRGVSGMYLGTARLLTRPLARAAQAAPALDPVADRTSLPGYQCSHYWQEHSLTLPAAYGRTDFPTANCGYLASQFRARYGATASMTGEGQTVATVLWYGSPTLVQDYNTFVKRNGGTPLTSATYRQILPRKNYDVAACGGVGGAQIEQQLDTTAVHGIAPKSKLLYVGGFNCGTGVDVAVSTILDDRLATIVSNSYGYVGELPADIVQVTENQYTQAIAEGIGMYFSSGDGGDETNTLDAPSADYAASSPHVIAVGGTTTEIAKDGSAALETGWGNHYDAVLKDPATGALSYEADPPGPFQSGSGGGESAVFPRPYWQDGVVTTAGRAVPDVAAVGDPRTGELIGYRQFDDDSGKSLPYAQAIYGGTSLSSPLFAAEVALVQQRTHRTFGFLNPLLYAAKSAGVSPLQDVVPNDVAVAYNDQFDGHTSLVTGNQDTSLSVQPGWDDVTGLGVLRLDAIPAKMR